MMGCRNGFAALIVKDNNKDANQQILLFETFPELRLFSLSFVYWLFSTQATTGLGLCLCLCM